jgi:hypothetical protein
MCLPGDIKALNGAEKAGGLFFYFGLEKPAILSYIFISVLVQMFPVYRNKWS